MDIYNFINSRDIEQYCREKHMTFKPIENAFLVWQSRKHTIQEKHIFYEEILNEAKDFTFYLREWDYSKISLQDFLGEYMRIEKKLLSEMEENKSAVFTYIKSEYDIDYNYPYNEKLYMSKETCFSAIKEFEQKQVWDKCKLIYKPILSDIHTKPSSISLYVNEEFKDVFVTETARLSSQESKIFHTFDDMKIDIPLPFNDHDTLIERYSYCAVPFEYKSSDVQFSDKGMALSNWTYPFEEELYVRNYLNLELVPKPPQKEYDPDDEDAPF